MSARLTRRFGDNPHAFAVGAGATALGGFVVALCTDAETAIAAQSMVLGPIFIVTELLKRRSARRKRSMASPLQRLLDSIETTSDQSDELSPGDLYTAYLWYAKKAGETPLNISEFRRQISRALWDKGIFARRSETNRFRGIRLKAGADQ
ncbi:hypothetical protein [Martelella sp. AMO21009]